jgi:hypothetical protein
VVAVVSPAFNEAASTDNGSPGVSHELSITRDLLHGDRAKWRPRIIPLVLPPWTVADIPLFMQPKSATRIAVGEVSEAGLAKLLAIVTNRRRTSPRMAVSRLPAIARTHRLITSGCSIALVGGIAFAAVACQNDGDNHAQNGAAAGEGNSVVQASGVCANVGPNSSCVVESPEEAKTQVRQLDQQTSSDTEMRHLLAKRARGAPTGDGPWPFVVVDTVVDGNDIGLFARTTSEVRAEHLGVASNHSVVWADCEATSDFMPPDVNGDTDVGPRWLSVRWKPVAPTALSVSEPNQDDHAWMYRGTLLPLDHDGHVPSC